MNRALIGESLETRHLMAGDVYLPFHNDLIPEDTNGDYTVSALDALLVINALNSGQIGELNGPGIGKAYGPMIDVSGDNNLSALDALRVINRVNGEGENEIVGFTFQVTDTAGNNLTSVSVDQLFQIRASVQDLRGFAAKGVFAAYLDLDFNNPQLFQLQVGETQSFRYFFDKILTSDTTSSFVFTFGSQTTAPISLFNVNGSPRSADQIAVAIQSALEALSSIGAGNVLVRLDPVGTGQDQEAGILRNSFDIQFVNGKAGQDVPLLVLDASNVKVRAGQTFEFTMTDKNPADINNPASFASAFIFTSEFSTGRTATRGTNQFDEIGAAGSTGTPQNAADPHPLFTVTLKALAAGTVRFTPNAAEIAPAHETLAFPKDVVPTNLILYGAPFNVTIASGVVANPDPFTIAEDAASGLYEVLANDVLVAGTIKTLTGVANSSAGVTPTIEGGQIRYAPPANFFGTDTFTYTVSNNVGNSATGTVTMTVTPVNDPISVPGQSAATNLGKAVTRTTAQLTVGGSVGPGEDTIQQLAIAEVATPTTAQGGTATLSSGSVTYTPKAGFAGQDTFVIVVTDNGQTNGNPAPSNQSVTVTVTVTNDPPDAVNDSFSVDEGTTGNVLAVLTNDSAGANDGTDPLSITNVTAASNGTVSISPDKLTLIYTPNASFVGTDTFIYTAQDSGGSTDTATVTVEVLPLKLPRASRDTEQVTEDSTTGVDIDVLLNDRVTVGQSKVLLSVGSAANGQVTLLDNGTPANQSDDKIRYIPNANFSGADTFTYVMNQSPNAGDNSTGTVTVNVTAVNDPPILTGDTVPATEDIIATIVSTTLLGNDSPGVAETGQQTLSITSATAVSSTGGSVAVSGGNVIYTPAPEFNGSFVFTYTATDNGSPALSGTATVTVNVAAVNDQPVVVGDSDTTPEDIAKTIQASLLTGNDRPGPAAATDEAGQTLTIVAVSATSAQGGSVSLAAGGASVTYTPKLDFSGTDTFTYTVRDNGNPTAEQTATVTMTVTSVNDRPIPTVDTVTAFRGVALTIPVSSLLTNDRPGAADESGQTLSIASVADGANGKASLSQDKTQIVFTPTAGFTGAANFTYSVVDNGVPPQSATGTVNVTVEQFVPSTISGVVYVDESNDGLVGAGERRVGGVTVTLVGQAFGQSINRSVITMADGSYDFPQLAPGSYTVSFAKPLLLIDGLDTPGALGDADGIANNNQFIVNITGSGGAQASNYNFALASIQAGYSTHLDRLATNYYRAGSSYAFHGIYAVIPSDGSQGWTIKLNGFDDIDFAEVVLNSAGNEAVLTIVDRAHNVFSSTLGRGKFISVRDDAGNTFVRVLGGTEQLQFNRVNLASPPVVSARKYLDAVDQIFSQEGWRV